MDRVLALVEQAVDKALLSLGLILALMVLANWLSYFEGRTYGREETIEAFDEAQRALHPEKEPEDRRASFRDFEG